MVIVVICLVSLAGVNISLGLTRLWRGWIEARMVRQVRAWPGLDAYHVELLGTAKPLCRSPRQVNRLVPNSARAAFVAVRLIDELESAEGEADPAHPVTAAAYRVMGVHPTVVGSPRVGLVGRDPGFRAALCAHLEELFAHAPATRFHVSPFTNDAALWSYGLGAAAPAVYIFFLLKNTAPGDPETTQGSFVLAFLVFVAGLIVLTAQAANTWHPLEDREVPAEFRRPEPEPSPEGSAP